MLILHVRSRPEDSETEVKYLRNGELAVIETKWGHVAGGGANEPDQKWMDKRIAEFLQGKTVDVVGDIDKETGVLRLA